MGLRRCYLLLAAVVALGSAFDASPAWAAIATWTGSNPGTWDTGTTNWSWSGTSGTPWDATNGGSNTAYMFGTANNYTINVSNTVYANKIDFSPRTGWTLTGGTINLAGTAPSIVDNSSAIYSTLAGTNGLTITATSFHLNLYNDNIYSGTTTISGAIWIRATAASVQTPFGSGNIVMNSGASIAFYENVGGVVKLANNIQMAGNTTMTAKRGSQSQVYAGTITLSATPGGTPGTTAPPAAGAITFDDYNQAATTFNNPIGGTGDVVFRGSYIDKFVLQGGASTYTGNTWLVVPSGNAAYNANGVTLTLDGGALPSTSVLTMVPYLSGTTNCAATLDLNGNDQTLAGLASASLSGGTVSYVDNTRPKTATLTINSTGNYTFDGVLRNSGAGSTLALVKQGPGTQILTAANTHNGNTVISGGILQLGNNLALQNSTLDTSGTGTLAFSTGVNTPTFGGLTGSNNLTLAANVTALTLNPGNGVTQAYSSNLAGGTGMSLTKVGAGTQVLSGSNSYTGGTTISGGALRFVGADSLPASGTLAVGGTGTVLDLADGTARTHTVGGLTLTSGAVLKMDWDTSPNADLITTAASATASGTVFLNPVGGYTSGNTYTFITAAGGLGGATYYMLANNSDYSGVPTVSGGTAVQLTPTTTTALTAAYWKGGQVSGFLSTMAVSNGTLSNWASDASGTATALVPGLGADVYFSITGGPGSYNNPTLGADMTVRTVTFNATTGIVTIGAGNTLTISPTASTLGISASDTATINAAVALGAAQTWTVASGKTLTVGGMIGGGAGSSLTKDGSGTLTLSAVNTYSGATTVSNGVLTITNPAALGDTAAGTTVAANAALQIQGGITTANEALTLNGSGVANGGALRNTSGNNNYTGLITLGSAARINSDTGVTLTLSNTGAITGSFGLTVGGAGNTIIYGGIATGTGSLTKDGAGALTLLGAGTYTGSTTISAGTLQLGNGGTTGSISPSTAISNSGTLAINRADAITFSNSIPGPGGFAQLGRGSVVLSGTNTYTGATTLSGGTLSAGIVSVAGVSGAFGVNSAVSVANAAGVLLDISGYDTQIGSLTGGGTTGGNLTLGARTLTVGGNNTSPTAYAGAISGSGGNLIKIGTGTQILSGTNTYSGTTTISAGTLKFGLQASLYNGNTANWTASNVVVNPLATLALNVGGVGEFTADNVNTLLALSTASGGFKDDSAIGLDTSNAGIFTPNSAIADPNGGANGLSLTKLGGGTLYLGNANTYTGTTTLGGAGTVYLGIADNPGTSGPLGSSTAANSIVMGGDTLKYSPANSYDYSGRFSTAANQKYYVDTNGQNVTWSTALTSSAGVLTKYGPGTLTLSASNTYGGTTTIYGGILQVGNGTTGSLGLNRAGTALTFGAGGTFVAQEAPGSSQSMGNVSFNAGDGTVQSTYAGTPGTNVTTLTFGTRGRSAGATANFVVSGGSNGTDNKIVMSQAANFIDQGTFFGGSDYAWMNTLNGYVRGINYGTDGNSEGITASAASLSITTSYARVSGTGQITAQPTQTITTLNIANSNNFTLAGTSLVTVKGILKSGNAAGGTISGGTIQAGAELVLRADMANDTLTIGSLLNTNNNALTKSGAGLMALSGGVNYGTGTVTVNGGTLAVTGSSIAGTGAINVNGGGTFQLSLLSLPSGGTATIGGPLTVGNIVGNGSSGNTVGNNVVGGTGPAVASILLNNNTMQVASASKVLVGGGNTGNGGSPAGHQLSISGGTLYLASGYLQVGGQTGGGGTITPGGVGTLNISGSNTVVSSTGGNDHIDLGEGYNSIAYFNMSGGSISFQYDTWGASGGSVIGYQTGGSNPMLTDFGANGNGTAIYTITGGAASPSSMYMGSCNSTFSVLGGNLTTGGLTVSNAAVALPGYAGRLNVAGGTVTASSVSVGTVAGANGIINLAGGLLAVGATGISGNVAGTSTVNLGGGTIQYNGGAATWMQNLTNAYVFPGGVTINTLANTGTINQTLRAADGYGVTGGTLSDGGAGYTAAPVVTFTGGTTMAPGSDAQAVATWNQTTGQVTGITIVNPGRYSVAPTGIALSRAAGDLDTWTAAATVNISTGANSGGGLIKTGSGTLTLSNSSTFNGPTTVSAGVLTLSNSLALQNSPLDTSGTGTVTLSSVTTPVFGGLKGSRDLFGTVVTTGSGSVTALRFNPVAGTSNTYSGVIANGSSNMTLTMIGAGTQVLTGNNTYTGPTAVQAGTLAFTSIANAGVASPLGQPNSANSTINLGTPSTAGTLRLVGSTSAGTDRIVNLTGNGTIDASSSASEGLAFTGTAAASVTSSGNYNLTLTGSGYGEIDKAVNLNAGGLTKNGTGTWLLSGSNNYTGGATVNAGTLSIGLADSLPTGNNLAISSGGHVVLAGGLSHAISLGGLTITSGAGSGQAPVGSGTWEVGSTQPLAASQGPAAPTPEPGTLLLLAAGAITGLAAWRRRRIAN